MKNNIVILLLVVFSFIFLQVGNVARADYNLQMSQRNSDSTELDKYYSITKASNAKMQNEVDIESTLASLAAYPAEDDTASLQAAINNGGNVMLKKGENYTVTAPLILPAGTVLDGNSCTIKRGNHVSGALLSLGPNCVVKNVSIDGNKTNQSNPTWDSYTEISTGLNALIENVRIQNAASEGIISYYDNVRIVNCIIDTCGGNGIHFSGSNNTVVENCIVKNTNLTSGVGHEDGCIIWSNQCRNIIVTNCIMDNGKAGIGSIDQIDNSDVTISNCIIRNCRECAIDMICPSTNPGNIVIDGNRIYNSVEVVINETQGSEVRPHNIIISNNYLEKTRVALNRVNNIIIDGNIVDNSLDNTQICINMYFVTNGLVTDNIIVGGSHGVYLAGETTSNVNIANNILTNQKKMGISASSANMDNVQIINNTISNTTASDAKYQGIYSNSKTKVEGNQLNLLIGLYGIEANNNSFVLNNIVRTPEGMPSIRTYGGSTGIMILNNLTVQPILNGGGDSNTLANNYIIEQ